MGADSGEHAKCRGDAEDYPGADRQEACNHRMATVSLVRCESYEPGVIDRAVKQAIDHLGGISHFVKPGDRVLLKPNLLSARPPDLRITTDPAVVRAVGHLVLDAGGRPFVGDSPGIDPFGKVADKTGMSGVGKDLGIDVVELGDATPVATPEGSVFKRLEIARQALEADVVINLPKLKAHSQMLLTLGVKNLFGTIVAQRKLEWHYMTGLDRDTFASLHLDIYLTVKPALTLLDGVWAMEGYGPSNGKPRHLGMIAASEDAIALDLSICRILGIPLTVFPLYRTARTRGIGQTEVARITLRGESPKVFNAMGFQIPDLDSLGILPDILTRFARRYLVSKPVHEQGECIGCAQCMKICPAGAIETFGEKRIRFDYDRCIRCYCCQEICPEDAIRFRKGWIVRTLNRFRR
jgi:uncharacterized protein (DUF362 family)/Pyruvate/2-oxoacid:ferredoxin oxidoreductase delta subunit